MPRGIYEHAYSHNTMPQDLLTREQQSAVGVALLPHDNSSLPNTSSFRANVRFVQVVRVTEPA